MIGGTRPSARGREVMGQRGKLGWLERGFGDLGEKRSRDRK
jgi:hypothetical protein